MKSYALKKIKKTKGENTAFLGLTNRSGWDDSSFDDPISEKLPWMNSEELELIMGWFSPKI